MQLLKISIQLLIFSCLLSGIFDLHVTGVVLCNSLRFPFNSYFFSSLLNWFFHLHVLLEEIHVCPALH